MGFSRYDNDTYVAYASTNLLREDGTRRSLHETFRNTSAKREFVPVNITVRESRDSELNPESRAIIFGIDVTGSMDKISHEMVNNVIPSLMESIIEVQSVRDPHILCMAIGDCRARDTTPLQASQFEGDIKIVEQLQDFYIEGGGGGNNSEAYDLAWLFASRYTSIDCFEKRGLKGYLFTIGDEPPADEEDYIDNSMYKALFGSDASIEQPLSPATLLAEAEEKYNVFHIIVEQGSYPQLTYRKKDLIKSWRKLLGKRVLLLDNYDNLAAVVQAAIAINEGSDPDTVIANVHGASARKSVLRALGLDD